MHKIKLKIGEFSKLNLVTVKTLRHYEEIGLLIPSEVDEWTNYRYYNVEQCHKMNKIIFLKKLGFTLEEIKEMFDSGADAPSKEMLEKKIEQTHTEQKQLQWRITELSVLSKQIHKTSEEMEQIFFKSLPARVVVSYRKIMNNHAELFDLCPNVIGPEMERMGCTCPAPQYCFTVDHNKEYRETNVDIEYCEAVAERGIDSDILKFKDIPEYPTAICINHHGPYEKLNQTFAKLYDYIEKSGYQIIDNPRFCYIDGIWNKENQEDWLTEIQVPVKK